MDRNKLSQKLDEIRRLAEGSRLQRLLDDPVRYVQGMGWAKIMYPLCRRSKEITIETFFGESMTVVLPSGLDIFLLGAKSHHSEIRLAQFMLMYLREGCIFYDVGAHLGFFTLLAAKLAGSEGKIISFEASPSMFTYCQQNVSNHANIRVYNKAVFNEDGSIRFYEFPILYSEYNSPYPEQYEDASWHKSNKAIEVDIPSVTLDSFVRQSNHIPDLIKIDVEGAETEVLDGADDLLSRYKPVIVMEYISPSIETWEDNTHVKAVKKLADKGYLAHVIQKNGLLKTMPVTRDLLLSFDSENLVFVHPENQILPCYAP
jgi:FkbM family methyltransferase